MALTRMLYDRELAVSERRVKPGSLMDHASLISGRQIIHILPEGYDGLAACIALLTSLGLQC